MAGLAGLGVLGILALWIESQTGYVLPAPTGPLAVGRSVYDWHEGPREVLVWVWYPAAGQKGVAQPWLPSWMTRAFRADQGPVRRLLERDPAKVRGHSMADAAVSPQGQYPVLILRGGASAEVVNYTTLAEDLASHGYVVVGIDAPERTGIVVFPDGRVVKRLPEQNVELCFEKSAAEQKTCVDHLLGSWTADIRFVVDRLPGLNESGQFAGRLDVARLGIFGHSFGGAQAAQFCHEDPRCKAGIDIDGRLLGSVVKEGLRQPFLFLLSGQAEDHDAEAAMVLGEIQSVYDRLPADGRGRLVIHGSNHFFFSDGVALLKSQILIGALRSAGILRIDAQRQLAITAGVVRLFFDRQLKGIGGGASEVPAKYPEVR